MAHGSLFAVDIYSDAKLHLRDAMTWFVMMGKIFLKYQYYEAFISTTSCHTSFYKRLRLYINSYGYI